MSTVYSAAEQGQINRQTGSLSEEVAARHHQLHPDHRLCDKDQSPVHYQEDLRTMLAHLSQAVATSNSQVIEDHIAWTKIAYTARGIPDEELSTSLQILIKALNDNVQRPDRTPAREYLQGAIKAIPDMPTNIVNDFPESHPLHDLSEAYLCALLNRQRQVAEALIYDAVREGVAVKDLYRHVFQNSQEEIGRRWQLNRMTIAQEHYCTAMTQLIISKLYPLLSDGRKNGRRFVGACVSGELHVMGIRMLTDFLEMEGWDTVYLGADMPQRDLIEMLRDYSPDVVGISATMMPHVGALGQMIEAIRTMPGCESIKIMVGGQPFTRMPELWREINADGFGVDADNAVNVAECLAAEKVVS